MTVAPEVNVLALAQEVVGMFKPDPAMMTLAQAVLAKDAELKGADELMAEDVLIFEAEIESLNYELTNAKHQAKLDAEEIGRLARTNRRLQGDVKSRWTESRQLREALMKQRTRREKAEHEVACYRAALEAIDQAPLGTDTYAMRVIAQQAIVAYDPEYPNNRREQH